VPFKLCNKFEQYYFIIINTKLASPTKQILLECEPSKLVVSRGPITRYPSDSLLNRCDVPTVRMPKPYIDIRERDRGSMTLSRYGRPSATARRQLPGPGYRGQAVTVPFSPHYNQISHNTWLNACDLLTAAAKCGGTRAFPWKLPPRAPPIVVSVQNPASRWVNRG